MKKLAIIEPIPISTEHNIFYEDTQNKNNALVDQSIALNKIYEHQTSLDPEKQLLVMNIYSFYNNFIYKDDFNKIHNYQKKLIENSITKSFVNFLNYYTQLTEVERKIKFGKDNLSSEDLFFKITNQIINNINSITLNKNSINRAYKKP